MTPSWPLRLWLRLFALWHGLSSERTCREIMWYDRTGMDLVAPAVLEETEDCN